MARQTDVRQAAAKVADDYIDAEDPHGNLAEQLCCDETFGALALAWYELDVELRHNEPLDPGTTVQIEDAMSGLEEALSTRASSVLEVEA